MPRCSSSRTRARSIPCTSSVTTSRCLPSLARERSGTARYFHFEFAWRVGQARSVRLGVGTGLLACALAAAPRAHAGGPLGEQGTRLATSSYGVDLFQGPVLGTSRVTGLGGAFTAIAEGTEGLAWNPAAASWRPP